MKYHIPQGLSDIYSSAADEYRKSDVFFLDEKYIRSLVEGTGVFSRTLDWLVDSAKALSHDSDGAIYALFLCRAMEHRVAFRECLSELMIPDDEHPSLAILCLLPYVSELYEYLTANKLHDDVVSATLGQFEDCLLLYEERFGRLGLNKRYFDHLQSYIDHKILNIGRLRFELHKMSDARLLESRITGEQHVLLTRGRMRGDGLYLGTPGDFGGDEFDVCFYETDSAYVGNIIDPRGRCKTETALFDKSEYFVRIDEGDDCLSVHIPPNGALTTEACEISYFRAMKIFATLHPERDFKGFFCHSWMMAPELDVIIGADSNIVKFQSRYLRYPSHTKGLDVMNFVFKTTAVNYADLPENTSLQRKLKRIYLDGGYLYEYNGIFTLGEKI